MLGRRVFDNAIARDGHEQMAAFREVTAGQLARQALKTAVLDLVAIHSYPGFPK